MRMYLPLRRTAVIRAATESLARAARSTGRAMRKPLPLVHTAAIVAPSKRGRSVRTTVSTSGSSGMATSPARIAASTEPKASAKRANSATDSSSARRVPSIPAWASARPAASAPANGSSARRSIFRRAANACLTTWANCAGSRTGASGVSRGRNRNTVEVTAGRGWKAPGPT